MCTHPRAVCVFPELCVHCFADVGYGLHSVTRACVSVSVSACGLAQFFAGLKGVDKAQVAAKVAEAIQEVGLTEKVNVRSAALSGGMKRKLRCLARVCVCVCVWLSLLPAAHACWVLGV